ncbi:endonuclease/exonuclease/phosphatase family protein [Alteromonas sp. ASW11-130]|uniref:endonuclease/exonuclease/phosphatase family protein n=1 Tax=Alteromonas sp. ASW11-130 TaxID=3015775 RepID=UPI002242AEEF|nr:endonuclease/exonuclease/phosphatase family protein [Alteromonas sp. ASW11-130]MCW8090296.1 endonuclease/exonuclease/phosphatase family protein [Alteromonas sp. ASW11-130]
MLTILVLLSILFLFTTTAPFLPGQHWLIRVWEFPRVQQAVLILGCMIGWTFYLPHYSFLSSAFILLLGVALAWQIRWIFPYTFLASKEVSQVESRDNTNVLSILTSNVYMYNKNSEGLCELVKQYDPDMLVTLESNNWWGQALSSLHHKYPHRVACPLENLYGIHLFSKLAFSERKIRYIVEDDVPSIEVTVDINGQAVKIYFLHPKPPSPTENESAEPRDHELSIVGREVKKSDIPVVIAGDLNDVAWSPTTRKFRKLSGTLDPRIGRGFFNTFHAKYPLIKWPLDHIFHSDDFDLVTIKRLPKYGSDHYPLYTKLRVRPSQSNVPSS